MSKITTTCMSLLLMAGLSTQAVQADDWTCDFEEAGKILGNNHNHQDFELNGIKWSSYALRAGSDEYDWKIDTCSVRLYGEKATMREMPYMQMEQDKEGGIGTVSFTYQSYSLHPTSQVPWIVQVSKDDGQNWNTIGQSFTPSSVEQVYTAEANYPKGRIRIVREDYLSYDLSKAGMYQSAFNFDNMTITDSTGENPDVPSIVADTLVFDFGEIAKGETATKTCNLTFQHLTAPIDINFKEPSESFTLSSNQIATEGATSGSFDITYAPTTTGNHAATVMISSGDISISLALKGSAIRKGGEFTYSGGTGTESDPYQIASPSDLDDLATAVVEEKNTYEGKHFKMTQDISMASVENMQPIGNNLKDASKLNLFKGHFDGDNHVIKDLKIKHSGNGVGLFGIVENAVIENIILENSTIEGGAIVGGIVGATQHSTVKNCHLGEGTKVTANLFYVGGIVGGTLAPTTISKCSNMGEITATQTSAGGIIGAGSNTETIIERCINYGKITSGVDYAGGIAGYSQKSISITDCANIGTVESYGKTAGGICSLLEEDMSAIMFIKDSYNCGEILSSDVVAMPIVMKSPIGQSYIVENCYYNQELFTDAADYGEGMSFNDMKNGTLQKALNRDRKPAIWYAAANQNEGMPIPYEFEGGGVSINDIQKEQPEIHVENGSLNISEGYTITNVFNTEGKAVRKDALEQGVYVVVFYANDQPTQPFTAKVNICK